MATIKSLLNQVLLECGFDEANVFATSTETDPKQVLALANREVNRLQKDTWQELKKLFTIVMTGSDPVADGSYDLPADYRQFIPDTAWATDQERKADFPVSDEVWSYLKARDVATGLTYRMRISDNQVNIHNPRGGEELPIQYISKYAVESNAGIPKERFDADDDVFLLNDDLLMLGVKWRFNKLKGLDWEIDRAEWLSMYNRERATNHNAQTINFAAPNQYPPFPPQTDLYLRP